MATVKSSDSKRQIAQPTSNKPPQKSTNKGEVKVVKNGIGRTFSRSIWDNLPPGKEGYQEVVEKQEIPAPAPQNEKPAEQPAAPVQPQAPQGNAPAQPQAPAPQPAAPRPAEPAKQSPTYDEAVKAYTDAYGEAPGQDLTIEEILAKVTAKKQEGK